MRSKLFRVIFAGMVFQLIAMLLPACQSIAAQNQVLTPVPTSTQAFSGQFVFVNMRGDLNWEDAIKKEKHVLVPNTSEGSAQNPVFSPDGKQIAYAFLLNGKDGKTQSQIRVIGTGGTAERVVFSPQDTNINVDLPSWNVDGKEILFTRLFSKGQTVLRSEIDRVTPDGSELTTLIQDGFGGRLSPDGKRLVFQRIDFTTYATSIWIANTDGSGEKQLIESNVFLAILGVQFGPDGQHVLFSESGPAMKNLPGMQGSATRELQPVSLQPVNETNCAFSILAVCLQQRAEAHGLPWDLWMVDVNNVKIERLTYIHADSPLPVWLPDGRSIVFFEASGILLLDLKTKEITRISSDGGYGGFDWHA